MGSRPNQASQAYGIPGAAASKVGATSAVWLCNGDSNALLFLILRTLLELRIPVVRDFVAPKFPPDNGQGGFRDGDLVSQHSG